MSYHLAGLASDRLLGLRAVNNADQFYVMTGPTRSQKIDRNSRALYLGAVERAFDVLRKGSANQSVDSSLAMSLIIQLM
ncbi:MAG TPA: hypothetical protein EYQ32_12205 [Gammaproteobacteria bacterium]|jgi:hypothetical protein|nr:hypothetical protein [Acidiferrobacteraceae bacterium]MDP6079720.1 hypothetical protein [Arenicellales bacterium]HIG15195.1 hypothetical protein [Gammaproteobacteria bacterium]HIL18847.1 hypothetical protein [Gammaproteobacteria bacterium]|tara:strand:- start:255 stop:491 length:237 start_codon:yes stop_codon:yes gene_type:complete